MGIKPVRYHSSITPLAIFLLFSLSLGLACSNSSSKSPSNGADSQKQSANAGTPRVTQRVYSPLVASGGTQQPTATVNIRVAPASPRVGESVTITVTVGEIASPTFLLFVRDHGVNEVGDLVRVTAGDEAQPGKGSSQIFELVSTQGESDHAIFELRAVREGTAEIWASVNLGGAEQGVSGGMVSEVLPVTVK